MGCGSWDTRSFVSYSTSKGYDTDSRGVVTGSYSNQEMAASSGFDANTLNMQLSMVTSPALMLLGVVITAVLAILGTLFGQRLLRKHFQKAGIVG